MKCWNCGSANLTGRSSDGVLSYECNYCGYGFKAQITMERDKVTDGWKGFRSSKQDAENKRK